MGFRQFSPYILTLEEKANAVRACEMLCIGQKLRQRRTGPRGNRVIGFRNDVFYPLIADGYRKLHALGRGLEEIAFFGGSLEQGHAGPASQHFRQDQAGKPGSGP